MAAAPVGGTLVIVGGRGRGALPGGSGGHGQAIGGRQQLHPTHELGALGGRGEHAQATLAGVAQKVLVLGQGGRGAVDEDEGRAAFLGRRQHRVDVAGQLLGADCRRGAAQVVGGQLAAGEAVERAVVHGGEHHVEPGLLHGTHEGPGVLGRGHHEGPRAGRRLGAHSEVVADGRARVARHGERGLLRVGRLLALGRGDEGGGVLRQGARRIHDSVQGVGHGRLQRRTLGDLGRRRCRAGPLVGHQMPVAVEADVLGCRFSHDSIPLALGPTRPRRARTSGLPWRTPRRPRMPSPRPPPSDARTSRCAPSG